MDLLIERRVVVELKSVEHLAPVNKKKVLTYLRLLDLRVGLLLNFGAVVLKDGIHRIVNKLNPADSSLAVNQAEPRRRGDKPKGRSLHVSGAVSEAEAPAAENGIYAPRLRVSA